MNSFNIEVILTDQDGIISEKTLKNKTLRTYGNHCSHILTPQWRNENVISLGTSAVFWKLYASLGMIPEWAKNESKKANKVAI